MPWIRKTRIDREHTVHTGLRALPHPHGPPSVASSRAGAPMSQSLVYTLLIRFLWLVTRVFFRNVEVVGKEHIPDEGPVIFVGNHPNSLIDPVMVLTSAGRQVSFAAKDTLFHSPLLGVVLRLSGAIPIKRRQDHEPGPGARPAEPLDNRAAFDALFGVLRAGGAFGIFPEGISHSRSELAPLKTGAARIALGAAAGGVPVRIVPCGLSYRRRERLRGQALVQFGAPLVVDAHHVQAWRDDEREAARALTAEIELCLRGLTINAKDFDTLRVLDGVRRLYSPRDRKLSLAERTEITRRFIDHWERYREVPAIVDLYREVSLYQFALASLGLSDRDLTLPLSRRTWAARLLRHLFFLVVLAPLALPGVLLHLPILILAVFAGDALTSRKDVVATTKMISATLLVLCSYGVAVAGVVWLVPFPASLWASTLTLALLLLSGWATIRVLERQSVLHKGLSVLATLWDLKAELARLRDTRERLRAELLTLVEQYADPDLERIVPPEANAG